MNQTDHQLITADDFEAATTAAPVVVIKFGAGWCSPCRIYDRQVLDLIEIYASRVHFAKVDIQDEKNSGNEAARNMKQKIGPYKAIPYLTIFKNGELAFSKTGIEIAELREKLEELLKNLRRKKESNR